MCYRAGNHKRRASSSAAAAVTRRNHHISAKDWCVLTLNQNMNSPEFFRIASSRSSSPETSSSSNSVLAITSPSNSSSRSTLDTSLGSSKSSTEGRGGQHSPVQSLESLQQCDDNDNLVPSNSRTSSPHFKCRKALGIFISKTCAQCCTSR